MSTAASRLRSSAGGVCRFVLMGVSGCGKSSVGGALAERLGATYVDGDDLHPEPNIRKMGAGIPLTDEDRWPWLLRVGQVLTEGGPMTIVGCSALKRAYRDRIRETTGQPVRFIHLAGARDVILARMNARPGHFMPSSLLDSQFAALEPPTADEGAVIVNIDQPLDHIVTAVIAALEEGER